MTTAVPIKQHAWVKWSLSAVDVIVDPFTGHCSVIDSPDAAVGEQVCCHHCSEPLSDFTVGTSCEEIPEAELP
jgi:hypothetical protein